MLSCSACRTDFQGYKDPGGLGFGFRGLGFRVFFPSRMA